MQYTDEGCKKVKEKISLDAVMRFLIHNSCMFTVAIMCLVHATLLGIMLYAKVPQLVSFNILSVVVYLFCIVLSKFGHILPVYVSVCVEVFVYAILSVYVTGWDCGSACFLFSIVPIIIYFGCFLFKGSKRWIVVSLLVLDLAIYAFLYIGFVDVKPLIEVAPLARKILILFSSFVMVFSTIFYNALYIHSSEGELVNLEQKNKKLSVDAQVDALTNMLNRRGFLPVVKGLMDQKGMQKEMHHFCIAFCDIDNFKRINDSCGHDCGDEVLRHISGMIKKEMYGCEICRWGGEEFVILMRDYDFAVAVQKMEYIRKCVETTPTVFYNKLIPATITIGLEEYSDAYLEPDDIIKVADERMYYGKQHGKNIVISEIKEA